MPNFNKKLYDSDKQKWYYEETEYDRAFKECCEAHSKINGKPTLLLENLTEDGIYNLYYPDGSIRKFHLEDGTECHHKSLLSRIWCRGLVSVLFFGC